MKARWRDVTLRHADRVPSFVPGTVSGLTFQLTRGDEALILEGFGDQTGETVLPIASTAMIELMRSDQKGSLPVVNSPGGTSTVVAEDQDPHP